MSTVETGIGDPGRGRRWPGRVRVVVVSRPSFGHAGVEPGRTGDSAGDLDSSTSRAAIGPIDLIGRPYVLSQNRLLDPDEFAREARVRGFFLSRFDLERLHRAHLLDPLYRVRRPDSDVRRRRRAVGRPYREPRRSWSVPKEGRELALDHADGLVADGGRVPYGRWARDGDRGVRRSEYLYSRYQLLGLAQIDRARVLQAKETSLSRWESAELRRLRTIGATTRSLIALLEALEPVYLPDIVLHRRMSILEGERAYDDYTRELRPDGLARELGWAKADLHAAATGLLREASMTDPLAQWLELVRQVHPDHWFRLQGSARLAIEQRVAAEMIFGLLDDLESLDPMPSSPAVSTSATNELNSRLRRDRTSLDEVLTYYDLSPHPSVVLALEGETELTLVPLVMEALQMPRRDSFVRLVNSHGENRDHALLVPYAALPHLGPRRGDAADFTRPPTRYMVVVDADQTFSTPESRESERLRLVAALWSELPSIYKTETARTELDSLVLIDTWADGVDFERAQFTDHEIAMALRDGGFVPDRLSITEVERQLVQLRGHGPLEDLWRRWPRKPRKPDLALLLWPVLDARIRAAGTERPSLDAIPVVRVLIRAWELALGTLRRNVMMRIGEPGS